MIRRESLAQSVKSLAAASLARTCSWATTAPCGNSIRLAGERPSGNVAAD